MSNYLGFNPCSEPGYFFVSYNSEDAERVGAIARKLHNNNVPLWYDYGIPYDEKWEGVIAEKVNNSKAVILFFTKGILFKENSYVRKEYIMAREYFDKNVYVVVLDDIDKKSVPVNKVSWFIDIRERQNINIVTISDLNLISETIMIAIGIKNSEKEQSQAIDNKKEKDKPFLAPVRESANTPMNNGDIFGGEPVFVGSFLGNSSDNIFLKKNAAEKEKQECTKTNKPDFSPIVPPASPSAPAVTDKLQQKNDTNNMSSENKSDGFDDDQFYIMINDIIKGKEPECDNENETIDKSSKNSSDGFEDDQFYIMIDDIIKGKDGVKKDNNEEDALKSVNDAFDKIDHDEHNRINDLLLKKAFEDFDEALNYTYSPEEKIEEINLEELELDFDDELSLLLREDNASDNEHTKNELQKLVNEVRLMNKTLAISSVGSADEAFVWLMFFDCELPYINSSVLPNKRTDESFEEYTAECARLAAVNEHTDFGVCISNVHTDKDSLERYIIVCVADSKRAKLKKIYAFDYESQEDMFIVAVIETFKMIIDFNQSENSHKSSAIFKFISKIKKK